MMAINRQYIFAIIFILNALLSYGQISRTKLSDKTIPLDSTVRFGKLDNGFTYYLKFNDHPEGEVVMKMIAKAGIFHEDEDQSEYAHLLEHVAVRDVEKYKDLVTLLNLNDIDHRAQTGRLSTSYSLFIPNSNQEKLNLGLTVLEQWAGGILIDSSRLDMHRGSILGELRPTDAYWDRLYNNEGEIILRNTTFPLYDRKKSIENVKNLDINRLKDFYQDWYRPDLQAAIVVGPFNLDSLENIIKNKFSNLTKPSKIRDPSKAIEKFNFELTGENQYESIKDTLNTNWRLDIFSKRINHDFKYRSEKDYYTGILQNLYEYIITKRKTEYKRQYQPPFSKYSTRYANNGLASNQISLRLMTVGLGQNPGSIERKIFEAVKADEIIHSNFTLQDLQEAKYRLKSTMVISSPNSSYLARDYENHFIYQFAAPSDSVRKKLANQMNQISLAELQKFADERRNLLKNSDFIFINVPKTDIPEKYKIEKIIKKAYSSPIPKYRSPLKKIYSIKNVADKNINPRMDIIQNTVDVTTVILENNIKVLLKPTTPQSSNFKNRIEVLGFQPIRFNGNPELYNKQLLAHKYASMAGTDWHNHFQIEEFKRDNDMQMNFETDKDNYLIEGNFDGKNLHSFFKLLFQYIKAPEDDVQAFNYWKKTMKERFSPYGVKGGSGFFHEKIEKIWNPKSPSFDEKALNKLSQKELLNAYKEHFSNFDEYTFIITGDFQSLELIEEIAPYLSGLPVSERGGEKIKKWSKRQERRSDTLRYKGIEQSFSELYLPVKIEPKIKNQVVLDLVNTAFYERLVKVLRLDCYGPGAGGQWISLRDSLYTFQINFNSELGNEGNMLANSMSEIEKLKKVGVDEDWLASHVKHASRKFTSQINSFGYFNFWPQFLKRRLEEGNDYQEYILKYPEILENFISLEDVNEAIDNYIIKDNLQNFLVLPE
ncbi:insulinase family protein [Salegentibacter sp. JZCK2]|uniref:M16 family metallopeptidase n=1 Tax=Salegentibacter tibetensis TaxID=2873600 RepID=UPI001CCA0A46|nr:insulinase family protein [Salegentibacter tibetensis]MBZ9731114.1 insulinase family protein [Salegentibacter tibetensis]